MILTLFPSEVEGLKLALRAGKVNGRLYEGPCACLIGTIANVRGCYYRDLPGIEPDANRPAEEWFTLIREGDTPETSAVVLLTLAWIEEWQSTIGTRLIKAGITPQVPDLYQTSDN